MTLLTGEMWQIRLITPTRLCEAFVGVDRILLSTDFPRAFVMRLQESEFAWSGICPKKGHEYTPRCLLQQMVDLHFGEQTL